MTDWTSSKLIEIEDFASPALRPHLERIAYDESVRFGLPEPAITPDARQWAGAMALKALTDNGAAAPGKFVAGLGAGTDTLGFVLAADGAVVFACDTYLELTPRSDVAPASMMARPTQFSVVDYPRGHVIPVHSDPRRLELPSDFFDGVYCDDPFASLESMEAVEAAAAEVGRILKPGGVASIVGHFRLDGPNDKPWIDETGVLFTLESVKRRLVRASGLQPVAELRDRISQGTYDGQALLQDFMRKAAAVQTLQDKRDATPNLVLFHAGFLFCPFHLLLRKPEDAAPAQPRPLPRKVAASVEERSIATSGALTQQIKSWRDAFARDDDPERRRALQVKRLQTDLDEAHACLAAVTAENHRNESALLALLEGGALPQWVWQEQTRAPLEKLHSMVGARENGALRSNGEAGVLAYGPYMDLGVGHYAVEFDLRALAKEGHVTCAVTAGGVGRGQVDMEVQALKGPVRVPFVLDQAVQADLEFPVVVTAGAQVELRSVRVLRRRPVVA